jgi:hypothetical protein
LFLRHRTRTETPTKKAARTQQSQNTVFEALDVLLLSPAEIGDSVGTKDSSKKDGRAVLIGDEDTGESVGDSEDAEQGDKVGTKDTRKEEG